MMEKYRLRDYPDRKNDIFGVSSKIFSDYVSQQHSNNRGKLKDNPRKYPLLPNSYKNLKILLTRLFIDEQNAKRDSKPFYCHAYCHASSSTINRVQRGGRVSSDSKIGQPSSLFFFHSLRKQNTVTTDTLTVFSSLTGRVSKKFYCHAFLRKLPPPSSIKLGVTVSVSVKQEIYIIPYYTTLNHIVYIIVYHLVRRMNNG